MTESLEDAPAATGGYDDMAEGYARYWAPVIRPAAVRVLDLAATDAGRPATRRTSSTSAAAPVRSRSRRSSAGRATA